MANTCCGGDLQSVGCPQCETQLVISDGSKPVILAPTPETITNTNELVGVEVEGYRLLRCLGSGAMGFVYLGKNASKNLAAIKVLRASLSKDSKILERFQREAHSLRRLHHASIVQMSNQGYTEGVGHYLVMEYLRGQTLEDRLRSRQMLDVKEVIEYAIQITDALSAAHQAGVVHRDLKPGNIFLVGPERKVKIFDFGIAKLLRGETSICTSVEVLVGTPCYMAPEQIRTNGDIDGRVDLYALGVVLFEMLTGKRPFEGKRSIEILMQHLEAPVPSLQALRKVPAELEALIIRCLQKRPEDRYARASQVRDSLRWMLQPKTTPARYFSTSPLGQCVFA